MAADRARLEALVAEVERFYVRDRALKRIQQTMRGLIDRGGEIADADAVAYLTAVRRYFSGFEREAREHLRSVDRRLAHISQVQFNLTAERGVTARRIEATQGVLRQLGELAAE
ncbi:MAG: hypothetical protein ACREM6_04495 [Vulcanimicrobiaceae bacterium]